MTIVEMLKDKDCHITHGSRWLTWGTRAKEWVVREQRPYAKEPHVLAVTSSESVAVAVLLAETETNS